MNKTYLYNLIVEEQLSRLTVSLSEQEYEILENIIISDGCQKIIETWNHIILDGFAEYAVCRQQQIPYYKKEVSLASYEEAVLYVCQKTLSQKNVPKEQYRYCIGRIYDAYKVFRSCFCQNTYQSLFGYNRSHQTSSQFLSEMLQIKPGTILKYKIYSHAIDILYEKTPQIAMEILSGAFQISHTKTLELSKLSPHEIITAYHCRHHKAQFCTAIQKMKAEDAAIQQANTGSSRTEPIIKQMPEYDPDAEVSSLALTIPTWISSIKRAQSMANFGLVSKKALCRLEQQLDTLVETINILRAQIEEVRHE